MAFSLFLSFPIWARKVGNFPPLSRRITSIPLKRKKKNIYIYIYVYVYIYTYIGFIYLAVLGLSCACEIVSCGMQTLSSDMWDLVP